MLILKRIDGGLEITLTPEGKEYIEERSGDIDEDSIFLELIEDYLANGWEIISPEEIGALTSGLLISDHCKRDDQGELVGIGDIFWDEKYQIESLIATLYTTGKAFMLNPDD